MGEYFIFGVSIFFVATIAGRFLGEKALKKLSSDDKILLLDSFSKYRVIVMIPLLLMLVVTWSSLKYWQGLPINPIYFLLGVLLLYIIGVNIYVFYKIRALKLNVSYLKQFIISRVIQHVGLVIFLVIILLK